MGLTHYPNGITSFGEVVYGGGHPHMGKVYHVRKTTDTNYGNWKNMVDTKYYDSTQSVQTTIAAAVAAADAGDTIYVWPGTWAQSTALAITQSDLRLIAIHSGEHGMSLCRTKLTGATGDSVITVEGAHNCEIAGFDIEAYQGADSYGISIAQSSNTYGVYVHDTLFRTGRTTYGPTHLRAGTATAATALNAFGLSIIRCEFMYGGCHGAAAARRAQVNIGRADNFLIKDCILETLGNTTDTHQIDVHQDSTYWLNQGKIIDNKFFCYEVGTITGIYSELATTDGCMWIDGNHFVGHAADANCFTYNADTSGLNYLNTAVIDS